MESMVKIKKNIKTTKIYKILKHTSIALKIVQFKFISAKHKRRKSSHKDSPRHFMASVENKCRNFEKLFKKLPIKNIMQGQLSSILSFLIF